MSSDGDYEYEVKAFKRTHDVIPSVEERFPDKTDALHQKALWERSDAEKVTFNRVSGRRDAYEEDDCLLCAPAPHPNCEKYTVVSFLDAADVPLGEDNDDHHVDVPVCIDHYQALKQYQNGKNVEEVDI